MLEQRLPAATIGQLGLRLLATRLSFAKCLFLVGVCRTFVALTLVFSRLQLNFCPGHFFLPRFDLLLPIPPLLPQPVSDAADLHLHSAEGIQRLLAKFA